MTTIHLPAPTRRRRWVRLQMPAWHPLTWMGASAGLVTGSLLVAQLLIVPWWHGVQDDWRYGMPRTMQMDAVVGGDSAAHPTHFIATNVDGHPCVIEIHASDPSHTSMLIVPMSTDPHVPVTLAVRDEVRHDPHPDLLVQVNGVQYVYHNDGHGTFRQVPIKP